MRILFITSNRIGDAILSTGLLDHLLHAHPGARITVACGPAAAGLFTHMPGLDRLIPFEKRPRGTHWLGLWRQTATTLWDLVVDIRASALPYLVPARRRATRRQPGGHKVAELASLLRLSPPPLPVVWPSAADTARALTLLPPGPPVIALGPTANWTGKVWPPDRFAALFHALAVGPLPGARLAVFGGPGAVERAGAAPLLAAIPAAIDLCGALSLTEAAACLGRCALFAGNDSGLMHLAAAAGAPTIGLFGPTPAEQYGPAGRHTATAISPDGTMAGLSVADTLGAATHLLAAAAPGGGRHGRCTAN